MSTQPRRLLYDPTVPESLRCDLQSAREVPVAFNVALGLERLQAAIQVPTVSGPQPTAPAPTGAESLPPPVPVAQLATQASVPSAIPIAAPLGSSFATWAAGAGAALVVSGAAVWSATRDAGTPSTLPATVPLVTSVEPVPAPPEPEAEPATELAPAPEAPPPQPARKARRARRGPGKAELRLRREVAHMARLRAALEGDPAQALRLARQGQRQFRRGMFAQERAALEALALDKLGRHEEARARARRFLKRHPKAPLSGRLRALLQQGDPGP